MKIFLKWTAWALAIVLLFCALAAAGVVSLHQFLPEGGRLQFGDDIIYLGEGASLGVGTGLLAWGLISFALFVSFFAVVFALGLTALALFATGLLLISPFVALLFVMWLMVRAITKRERKHSVNAQAAAPSPAGNI